MGYLTGEFFILGSKACAKNNSVVFAHRVYGTGGKGASHTRKCAAPDANKHKSSLRKLSEASGPLANSSGPVYLSHTEEGLKDRHLRSGMLREVII